jgi:NAD-dependent SIR2 family protein deacetylase
VLVNAQDHSRKADVVIAIGTSLRVEPAASLVSTKLGPSSPRLRVTCALTTRTHDTTRHDTTRHTQPLKSVKRGGKLAIINLQKTPYDSSAHLRIFAHCDHVMQLLMQTLGTVLCFVNCGSVMWVVRVVRRVCRASCVSWP